MQYRYIFILMWQDQYWKNIRKCDYAENDYGFLENRNTLVADVWKWDEQFHLV